MIANFRKRWGRKHLDTGTKECEDDDKDELHSAFVPPANYIKISQGQIHLVHQSKSLDCDTTEAQRKQDREILEKRILELEGALLQLQEKVNNSQCGSPTFEKELRDQLEKDKVRKRKIPKEYLKYLRDPNLPIPESTLRYRNKRNDNDSQKDFLDSFDVPLSFSSGYDVHEGTTEDQNKDKLFLSKKASESSSSSDESEYEEEYMCYGLEENSNRREPEYENGSSDEGNQGRNNAEERHLLYEGSRITKEESEILILSYIARHGGTDLALEDLLELVNCHLPYDIHKSKYLFLRNLEPPHRFYKHYYCPDCQQNTQTDWLTGQTLCTNCNIGYDYKILQRNCNYFIQLSIQDQLEILMSSENYYKIRRNSNVDSDVISGSVYKNLIAKNVLGPHDLTLQINTDGVQPWKCSSKALWPVFLAVNELPYKVRSNNTILAGLWYGNGKPDMNMFLKPIVEELNYLHNTGFDCLTPNGEEIHLNVHTIVSPVDSVARPQLQNIHQYNGDYGCSFCLHPGNEIQVGRGNARIYQGTASPRTIAQHEEDCKEALATNKPVRGVKGPSVLQLLTTFNIISSFVPDYMHAILLGVVKTFVKAMFDPTYRDKNWYLGNDFDAVDGRLLSIKPCLDISRTPRSLKLISNWKASECKNFVLYYSLYCFSGYLPRNHLKHWLLLIRAMHILLQEKITANDIERAKRLLATFVRDVEILYGREFYRFNTHLLLHVPAAVTRYGALWACSTFPYESFNNVLTHLIKSSSNAILEQICKLYLRWRFVERKASIVFSFDNCTVRAKKFYLHMSQKIRVRSNIEIGPNLRLCGSPRSVNLSLPMKLSIEELLGDSITNAATTYDRFIYKKKIYHSKDYRRMFKRNNSVVKLNNANYVEILGIFCITLDRQTHGYRLIVLANTFDILQERNIVINTDQRVNSNEIFPIVRITNNVVAFFLSAISKKCIKIEISNDEACIIPLVNTIERD